MDYKEAFETLLERMEKESNRASEHWKTKFPEGFDRPNQDSTKDLDWWQFEEAMRKFGNERYARGQMMVLEHAVKFAKGLKEEVEKSACE